MAFGASAVGAIAVGVAAFLLIGPSTRVMDVVRRRRSPSTAQARSVSSWRGRPRRVSLEQAFAHDLRALVAELRSGAHPGTALSTAASSTVLWPRAVAAERFGDVVADGFARDALQASHVEVSEFHFRNMFASRARPPARNGTMYYQVESDNPGPRSLVGLGHKYIYSELHPGS